MTLCVAARPIAAVATARNLTACALLCSLAGLRRVFSGKLTGVKRSDVRAAGGKVGWLVGGSGLSRELVHLP